MKRVALMIPTIDRMGGAERQVLLLARGLAERGWRVTVIALSGTGGARAASLDSLGIGFVSLRMRKGVADPRGWIALRGWLRRERPDVLHAHLPHAAWMARWSRLFAAVPVVVDTVHTAATGARGRKVGYRMSNWLTDQVTVVSRGAAEAWAGAGVISAEKLAVLPNGVDTQCWKPDASMRVEMRELLGVRDEFLWLAAGRLEAVKDFAALLRAFAGLPLHARLVIAGDGALRAELEAMAESLGVAERVRLAGHVEDVAPWMQAADGFVLSSLWEGLPMSLLEAGACGLPAVSTAVAGAEEILPTEQRDFIARVGDVPSLRDAMVRMMQLSAEEREQMGLLARLHVEQHYSLGAVLDRWEELYDRLLRRKRESSEAMREAERTNASAHDAGAGAR